MINMSSFGFWGRWARRSMLSAVGALVVVGAVVSPGATGKAAAVSFADVTESSGVGYPATMTWGSNWVDHDADGDPDLFANRHWKAPRFYENEGGTYSLMDVTFPPPPSLHVYDRHTCSWGEANGDGRVDLYCLSGAQKGEGFGPKQLWIQTEAGFVNRARAFGVKDKLTRARHVSWIDYDSDGDLDIFIANKLRSGYPNTLFRHDGDHFTRVNVGLNKEMNALGTSWSDWDRDGDPDLVVTRYKPELTVAYRNDDGEFSSIEIPGVTGEGWNSAVWGDYDGDGWTDLQLVGRNETSIMRNVSGNFEVAHSESLESGASSAWLDVDNDGDLDSFVVQGKSGRVNRPDFFLIQNDGAFSQLTDPSFRGPTTGSGESVSVADDDRDGRLDLFVTNGAKLAEESLLEGPWALLRNRSESGNWVALELAGMATNPWGYGARIFVDSDGPDYWREITDGMGLRAQSEIGHLVLGIGDAARATLRIEWPGGATDCVEVDQGETVTAAIGEAPC